VNLVNASTTADGNFNILQNRLASIINNTNIDSGSTGYVDIVITIPVGTHVQITSIQIVGVQNENSSSEFLQETTARQIDHLFHYYSPKLNFKAIQSLLVGWDFPLNPRQFGAVNVSATLKYVADQTLAAAGPTGFNTGVNSSTNGMYFTSTGNASAMYLQQYLSGAEAKKILGSRWSVNLQAYASATGVTAQIYLCRAPSGSSIPMLNTPLGTINSSGVFSITYAGWTPIPNVNYVTTPIIALKSIPSVNSAINSGIDYGINGWQVIDDAQVADTQYFAIVVTFSVPVSGTTVLVDSISLVPGDIPTRPALQTIDEVLRECQYYYQSSYSYGVVPGTSSVAGCLIAGQGTGFSSNTDFAFPQGFGFQWPIITRSSSPTILLYNPGTGTSSNVICNLYVNGSLGSSSNISLSSWTKFFTNSFTINYIPNTSSQLIFVAGNATDLLNSVIFYHYSVDSRLAMVA
jgi:hypothetical protein